MNYNKSPVTVFENKTQQAWKGWKNILQQLRATASDRGVRVLAVETYPGVDDTELTAAFRQLNPVLFVDTKEALLPYEEYHKRLAPILTDDRVFGRMFFGEISDFQVPEKVSELRKKISDAKGLAIVYGMGAAELACPDMIVYADMARWEIQTRFRRGASNYYSNNGGEDNLIKFKQGYFFEWRLADRIKRRLYEKMDFYLDTNRTNDPSMLTGAMFRHALDRVVKGPFRTVPYFDPGVWGGQWMKGICGLDPDRDNFAWSFDGVPEENSVYFKVNGILVESPAINLVFYRPKELLGPRVYACYGAEFPIRFDFLDTMDGGNLSLQVHPLTDYIHNQFGMAYTQDESYYILDAKEDACVYLGIRDGVKPEDMVRELRSAQQGGESFPAERYVNRFPAKKHDHFLIPAGTVHCSGRNCMVLEVSATPYIFTFKLWDWDRLGLDGKPRPIHLNHGEKVIQWDRRTDWVRENLVNRIRTLRTTGEYTEEKTGLHPLEPIETRRYTITGSCELNTENNVNMLNLVDGEAAIVESPSGAFEPYEVHYAETFIVPAAVGAYTIRPANGKPIKVLKAYVRQLQEDDK